MKAIVRLAALAALFASFTAHAGYSCIGPVLGVTLRPDGALAARSAGGLSWPHFCYVNTAYNGVDAVTCRTIYSLLLTAETTGKQVEIWFNDEPNGCQSKQPWTFLSAWYYGPALID